MLPSLPRLADYEISPQNGFLPSEVPLDVLPNPYYQPWEIIARNFQRLILNKRLRQMIDVLPVLSTDLLVTEAEWRRAYSVLGFFAHAYIWGGDVPADVSFSMLHTCNRRVHWPSLTTYVDRPPVHLHPVPANMHTPRASTRGDVCWRLSVELASHL